MCPDATSCGAVGRANELSTTATHRALVANLAFGAAAVTAIGATVLWFAGAPVAPAVSRGEVAVVVSGRF